VDNLQVINLFRLKRGKLLYRVPKLALNTLGRQEHRQQHDQAQDRQGNEGPALCGAFTALAGTDTEQILKSPGHIEGHEKQVDAAAPDAGYKQQEQEDDREENVQVTRLAEVGTGRVHAGDLEPPRLDVNPGQKTTPDQEQGRKGTQGLQETHGAKIYPADGNSNQQPPIWNQETRKKTQNLQNPQNLSEPFRTLRTFQNLLLTLINLSPC
jgi:hypothetical protein